MTTFEIVLGVFAVLCVVWDGWKRGPTPGDSDHATTKEREQAVRIRQLRLSHAMKKRGVHLLAGKHYRPVLTKTEPITAKPRLAAVRGGKQ